MNSYRSHGFSLMEALLAIIVVVVASFGVYSLFNSGSYQAHLSDATTQAVEIANIYTDLASSHLTGGAATVPELLQNSGRLSSKYFSSNSDGQVNVYNAFGQLAFTKINAYSFSVDVPLGCFKGDVESLSSVPAQFFSKVKDMYSCNDAGNKDYATCASKVIPCSGTTPTTITVYFSMSY